MKNKEKMTLSKEYKKSLVTNSIQIAWKRIQNNYLKEA